MKLNKSFFINTALTITLFSLPILSANAKEMTNYAEDHGSKSHGEATTAIAADSHGDNHGATSSSGGFLSKHTTEVEFTFAIMVIIVGMIISDKFQSKQEQHHRATSKYNKDNLVNIEDKLDLPKVG